MLDYEPLTEEERQWWADRDDSVGSQARLWDACQALADEVERLQKERNVALAQSSRIPGLTRRLSRANAALRRWNEIAPYLAGDHVTKGEHDAVVDELAHVRRGGAALRQEGLDQAACLCYEERDRWGRGAIYNALDNVARGIRAMKEGDDA